ncbi:glutamate cyclase domain-containing protein [Micromonospora sonneratiae]|uniref:Glutamate cyclase domain-containing protein n=1 Tax=Micromonospora sonneratiae TaxID=1184706 RepID=A0ABW3YPM8_9ACTN
MAPVDAPLHRLYTSGRAFRIGIGDGGNEIGMGLLPAPVITSVVDRGSEIRCVVDCDARRSTRTPSGSGSSTGPSGAPVVPEVDRAAHLPGRRSSSAVTAKAAHAPAIATNSDLSCST